MAKPTSESYKLLLSQLAKWPADPLRPTTQFAAAMSKRVSKLQSRPLDPSTSPTTTSSPSGRPPPPPPTDTDIRKEAQAISFLITNRYAKKYPLSDRILQPHSNPEYFQNIIKDLDETKTRSWLGGQLIRWKGLIRLE